MKKAELVANYFATIYLTFISLLQSVALSQLIPLIIIYFNVAEHPWTDLHMIPLLLMLLIIFIVWHHYAIGIFFLRWFPNIIDTIIPFVISIGQFFLISYMNIKTNVTEIDIHAFEKGFSIFLVFGCLPYFAASVRNKADLFTNIMSLDHAIIHSGYIKKYYGLAGWSILVQGLFALLIVLVKNDGLLWVSFFMFLAHLFLSEYYLLVTIRPHFDMALDEHDKTITDDD